MSSDPPTTPSSVRHGPGTWLNTVLCKPHMYLKLRHLNYSIVLCEEQNDVTRQLVTHVIIL